MLRKENQRNEFCTKVPEMSANRFQCSLRNGGRNILIINKKLDEIQIIQRCVCWNGTLNPSFNVNQGCKDSKFCNRSVFMLSQLELMTEEINLHNVDYFRHPPCMVISSWNMKTHPKGGDSSQEDKIESQKFFVIFAWQIS